MSYEQGPTGQQQPGPFPPTGQQPAAFPPAGYPASNYPLAGYPPPSPQMPPKRSSRGLIIGICAVVVVVVALISGAAVWVAISLGHNDGEQAQSHVDYAAFARQFVVDLNTRSPGDSSRLRAAVDSTCANSDANRQLSEVIKVVEQAGGTSRVTGEPRAAVENGAETSVGVPVLVSWTTETTSRFSTTPTTHSQAATFTVRPGPKPCVARIETMP